MSDRDMTVSIRAQDNASKTFLTVANAADKMGASAAKAGQTGARGLKELDAAVMKNQQEFLKGVRGAQNYEASLTKVGAAAGTIVGVLGKLGQAQDRERQTVEGLQRAYGSASTDIQRFGDLLQQHSRFSDQASDSAALLASTLVTQYGLSTQQVEQLIARSADLASIYKIDLVDAVQRTSSALRGEAESAELLGVSLSDSAVQAAAAAAGLDGWNTTMSEAEKAAFRFDLLMKQTVTSQGAARVAAEGTTGQVIQLKNEFQDLALKLSGALGPATETAAVLGDMALIAPVLGAGLGKLVGSLKASETGFLGMAAAGAKGLATLGAFGILGGAGYLTYDVAASWGESGTSAADSFFGGFISHATDIIAAGSPSSTVDRFVTDVGDQYRQILKSNDIEQLTIDVGFEIVRPEGVGGSSPDQVIRELGITIDTLEQRAHNAGRTIGQQLVFEAERLGYVLNQVTGEFVIMSDAADSAALSAGRGMGPVNPGVVPQGPQPWQRRSLKARGLGDDDGRTPVDGSAAVLAEMQAAERASIALANSLRTQLGQAVGGLDGSLAGLSSTLGIVADDMIDVLAYTQSLGMAGGGNQRLIDSWLSVADAVSDVGAAYDSVLGIFSTVDALGQRSTRATGIADELIGDPGEWATIDDLLKNAAISREQYDDAVAAGYRIQSRDVAIQEDLNAIRAEQLPLLAEQQERYAVHIDRLAHLSAEEQQYATYLMDSSNAAKVASVESTLYAASLGQIPEEVASDIVIGAAQADPILYDILEKMGVIHEGANGEITVTFPDEGKIALTRFENIFGEENVTVDKYGLIHVEQSDGAELVYDPFFNLIDQEPVTERTVKISVKAQTFLNGVAEDIDLGNLFGGGPGTPETPVSLPLPATPPGGQPTTVQPAVPRIVPTVRQQTPEFGGQPAFPNNIARVRVVFDGLKESLSQLGALQEQAVEPLVIPVDAYIAPAEAGITEVVTTAENTTGTVTIDGVNDPAMESITLAVAAANAANAIVDIDGNRGPFNADVAAVNGRTVGVAYIDIRATGGVPGGLGESFALGGVVPHAMHGIVGDGRDFLVGEAGPEMVRLPGGSYVHTAPATKEKLRNGGGSGGAMYFYGPVNVYPPDQNVYEAITNQLRNGGR